MYALVAHLLDALHGQRHAAADEQMDARLVAVSDARPDQKYLHAATMASRALSGSALGAERQMWDATLERGMVELKHKQILARVEVLNSMNTQAMLVAGAAVASLGGESLQTLDDAENPWHTTLSAAFVATSAVTMACSLWVIVVASNLIMLVPTTTWAVLSKIKVNWKRR